MAKRKKKKNPKAKKRRRAPTRIRTDADLRRFKLGTSGSADEILKGYEVSRHKKVLP